MTEGLEGELVERLRAQGSMSVADFMGEALGHPRWGYYRRAEDPFGVAGDFVTAPEISQVFGELIGVWAAVVWQMIGAPDSFVLAELGPGRGTLMADLLRATASVPAFQRAVRIHCVETSASLRERQRQTLAGREVVWLDDVKELPAGPMIVIANEFFDALPIRQIVKRGTAWRERRVGLHDGKLSFVDGPLSGDLPADIMTLDAPEGAVFEINDPARHIVQEIGRRLIAQGGVALIIDYGHPRHAVGDTLQAVRRHKMVPPLEAPGESDLTAHVDFQALADAARPAFVTDVIPQGQFLTALNINVRAERLMALNPGRAEEIVAGYRRLIDAEGMGTLFKTMAITQPGLPSLPGCSA